MPLNLDAPETWVPGPVTAGRAAADLTFEGGVFVSDPDGDACAVSDVWVERIVDADDTETDYGKGHPLARPSYFSVALTRLADGPGGATQYALRPSVDPNGPGDPAEWKYLLLGFTVTDGANESDGVVWIVSPEFDPPGSFPYDGDLYLIDSGGSMWLVNVDDDVLNGNPSTGIGESYRVSPADTFPGGGGDATYGHFGHDIPMDRLWWSRDSGGVLIADRAGSVVRSDPKAAPASGPGILAAYNGADDNYRAVFGSSATDQKQIASVTPAGVRTALATRPDNGSGYGGVGLGNGRIWNVGSGGQIQSFALDGSDPQDHGNTGQTGYCKVFRDEVNGGVWAVYTNVVVYKPDGGPVVSVTVGSGNTCGGPLRDGRGFLAIKSAAYANAYLISTDGTVTDGTQLQMVATVYAAIPV